MQAGRDTGDSTGSNHALREAVILLHHDGLSEGGLTVGHNRRQRLALGHLAAWLQVRSAVLEQGGVLLRCSVGLRACMKGG